MDLRFSLLAFIVVLSFEALKANEFPELTAAEQHMSTLVQGRRPSILCFSLEDSRMARISIFETGDANYRYILSYTRPVRGTTEPKEIYRVATSNLRHRTRTTLYTETEISLNVRGNSGSPEPGIFDGELRARKERNAHWYRLIQPFAVHSANINLPANLLSCRSVAQ